MPRILTPEEAAMRVQDELVDENPTITNFVSGSFDDDYVDALGEILSYLDHKRVAAELSGQIEFSGGPVTEAWVRSAGYDSDRARLDWLDEATDRSDLDKLARQNGVERDPGEFATGEVLFTTNTSETEIPAETVVSTPGDSGQRSWSFVTTETVTPDTNATAVLAPIRAVGRGDDWNVGSDSITEFDERPTGVESVTNPDATSGGEDEEGQASLRERTRTALTRASGGGTKRGIEGDIIAARSDVDLGDVLVVEHHTPSVPPYDDPRLVAADGEKPAIQWGEVVIDSAAALNSLQEDVEDAKPAGVYHHAARPTTRTVDVSGTVVVPVEEAVYPGDAEAAVADYISDLGLGADLRNFPVFNAAYQSSEAIEDVNERTITLRDEEHVYESGTDEYALDVEAAVRGVRSIRGTVDGSQTTFEAGTDYAASDGDNDGYPNTIDFGTGGRTPDDGSTFFVTYDVANDIPVDRAEKIMAGAVSFKASDASDSRE